MGTISYYARLFSGTEVKQPVVPKEMDEVFKGKPLLNDAKPITLAEYDVDTKDMITAHHLKDYRRKKFNLVLLPKIVTLFDCVLEGSEYWRELLHNESTYT